MTVTMFTAYRTKLLSQKRAAAFASALRRNSRFSHVSVEQSSRAKGDACWFVRFEPSSEIRRQALVDAQDSSRARRGLEQEFTFVRDTATNSYLCFSHTSGNVYSVTEHSCDCPDSQHRLTGTAIRCKHRYALIAQSPAELGPAPVRSETQDRFDAIFGVAV